MDYHKFEKIVKGDNPIIRVTYITWTGRQVVRDVCRCGTLKNYWVFMDNGRLTHRNESINTFYNNNQDVYYINDKYSKKLKLKT